MRKRLESAFEKTGAKRREADPRARARAPHDHADSQAARVLTLQRLIGNQAVQRLLHSGTMQASLHGGGERERHEREADRVVGAARGNPETTGAVGKEIPRKPVFGANPLVIRRQADPEGGEAAAGSGPEFGPPLKTSIPTPGRTKRLRDWLYAHVAGHALAATTYRFYEILDDYLGPWGMDGYPIAYGKKYNILFTTNKALMANAVTKDWVWQTTILLQKKLADYVVGRYAAGALPALKEEELRRFAFDTHPLAYTEAGLAVVVLTAPELLPEIMSIPSAEFNPSSPNFEASLKQVFETAKLVLPQAFALLLAAAMPAHSGMLKRAADQDMQNFLNLVKTNQYLANLRKAIESGEVANVALLDQMTESLYKMEFPDQDFAQAAMEIIKLANAKKKEIAKKCAEAAAKNPNLKAVYDKLQPGWEKWL